MAHSAERPATAAEIVEAADIVDVVSEYVPLKRAGKDFKAPCPFHSETQPSFYVIPSKRMFYCHGCKAAGNAIQFVQRLLGIPFHEAARRVAQRYGLRYVGRGEPPGQVSVREKLCRVNAFAARFFAQVLSEAPEAAVARDYVARRGISSASVQAFGLGFAPADWHRLRDAAKKRFSEEELVAAGLLVPRETGAAYDRFRGRLMFPITNLEGEVVAFGARAIGDEEPKYLNSPESAVFAKGKTLYGLAQAREAIRRSGVAVVVEGYTDVIAAHQAGRANVLATLGTSLTADHVRALSRLAQRVIVAYDADSAGKGAVLRSTESLENSGLPVEVAVLPAGEDPDSLLRERGPSAFDAVVAEAVPLVHFAIDHIVASRASEGVAGRERAAEEIADLLAAIRKPVARSGYIAYAASRLAGSDPGRVASLERALGEQLRLSERKRLRAHSGAAQGESSRTVARPVDPRRDRGFVVESVSQGATAELRPAVVQAERVLLRSALADRGHAERIFRELPPDRFLRAVSREIARELQRAWASGAAVAGAEILSALSAAAAEEFGEVVLPGSIHEAEGLPLQQLDLVRDHWEEQRFRELRERVARIPPEEQRTSDDVREFMELVRRRHAGPRGRFSPADGG